MKSKVVNHRLNIAAMIIANALRIEPSAASASCDGLSIQAHRTTSQNPAQIGCSYAVTRNKTHCIVQALLCQESSREGSEAPLSSLPPLLHGKVITHDGIGIGIQHCAGLYRRVWLGLRFYGEHTLSYECLPRGLLLAYRIQCRARWDNDSTFSLCCSLAGDPKDSVLSEKRSYCYRFSWKKQLWKRQVGLGRGFSGEELLTDIYSKIRQQAHAVCVANRRLQGRAVGSVASCTAVLTASSPSISAAGLGEVSSREPQQSPTMRATPYGSRQLVGSIDPYPALSTLVPGESQRELKGLFRTASLERLKWHCSLFTSADVKEQSLGVSWLTPTVPNRIVNGFIELEGHRLPVAKGRKEGKSTVLQIPFVSYLKVGESENDVVATSNHLVLRPMLYGFYLAQFAETEQAIAETVTLLEARARALNNGRAVKAAAQYRVDDISNFSPESALLDNSEQRCELSRASSSATERPISGGFFEWADRLWPSATRAEEAVASGSDVEVGLLDPSRCAWFQARVEPKGRVYTHLNFMGRTVPCRQVDLLEDGCTRIVKPLFRGDSDSDSTSHDTTLLVHSPTTAYNERPYSTQCIVKLASTLR